MTILLGTPNICLVDNKKAHRSSYLPMCFANCEISMKQTASHSQTPTFVKNESNTKPVLYQHPTPAEMRTPRLAIIKANIKDFGIFVLTALVLWFVISLAVMNVFGG